MSEQKPEAVKRVEVTLKEDIIQGKEPKKAGEKIEVTPKQKVRLEKAGII
ncbi:MAG: hypothetical protein OQK69_08690 [Gammaproteobacteria bacterium]|nr:hypothetical protein [Gammaproteobacteria bacterium]